MSAPPPAQPLPSPPPLRRVGAAFERVFEFCASVKLAIVVISGIAFFLAAATFYEARYGTQAVQDRVYGAWPFLAIMAALAINVMAAVVIRYPWKRKQTGFIITHVGIELLLAGCLVSFRRSVDGRVALREGETASAIDLNAEQIALDLVDDSAGAGESGRTLPVKVWGAAGYPGLARFAAGVVAPLPESPRWAAGHVERLPAGPGATVEVVDWLPAARLEQECVAAPGSAEGAAPQTGAPGDRPAGFPAVRLRIGGTTPTGAPADEGGWLYADSPRGAVASYFNGVIEASLWRARDEADVREFLHPPPAAGLGAAGQLAASVGDRTYRIAVDDALNQPVPLGDSGWSALVEAYLPRAELRGGGLENAGPEPTHPVLRVRLIEPGGAARQRIVSARYPSLPASLAERGARPGAGPAGEPLLVYHHPAVYGPARGPERGRLQLLQGPDGRLHARTFGVAGLREASEVFEGREYPGWMGSLHFSVTRYVPRGVMKEEYRPARAARGRMGEALRAAKVAAVVDGRRSPEVWLARGGGPKVVATPRGPAMLSYAFERYPLPFDLTLLDTERAKDPGADTPANSTSHVLIAPRDEPAAGDAGPAGKAGRQTITLNAPLTVAGLTIYQAGSDEGGGLGKAAVLSVRRDPGAGLKYVGCGLIVGGIFTMFYMKAYFQKAAPRPAAAPAHSARAAPKDAKGKGARKPARV